MQAGKASVAGIIRSLFSLIRKRQEERPSAQPAEKKRRKRHGPWKTDKSKSGDKPAKQRDGTAEEKQQADKPVFLETNIDKLYSLIKEKKSISIDDAAKKFGLTEHIIEEWCRMLEEHGMIELHYPAFGKPEIRIRKSERKYVSSHVA